MNTTGAVSVQVVDGVEKSCIRLGGDDFQPPKHMMQGEKMAGLLVRPGKKTEEWMWDGLATIEAIRYVHFSKMDIQPWDTIAGRNRSKALSLALLLARGLTEGGRRFAAPLVNMEPIYRFYVVDGDSVLILPPDLGDLINIYMDAEERQRAHGDFLKSGTEPGFSMIRQFGEMLYWALVGEKPYERREVRDSGYREIPLEAYREKLFPNLPEETEGFINFTLRAREREQRDIMGNRRSDENLAWFTEKASGLGWDVPDMDPEDMAAARAGIAESEDVKKLMEKIAESAKKRNFWRAKGAMITTIAVVVILVVSIVASYIANLLEPPATAGLGQTAVIEAFYDGQNNLDIEAVEDALKGCEAPQGIEVMNMFVTKQTRFAYESIDPLVKAEEWEAAGRPAILATCHVYGVTDIEIEQTGENTYRATGKLHSPSPYDEATEAVTDIPEGQTLVYIYDMSQDFTFTWNDRGWWNITEVSGISVQLDEVVYIDTYERTTNF